LTDLNPNGAGGAAQGEPGLRYLFGIPTGIVNMASEGIVGGMPVALATMFPDRSARDTSAGVVFLDFPSRHPPSCIPLLRTHHSAFFAPVDNLTPAPFALPPLSCTKIAPDLVRKAAATSV